MYIQRENFWIFILLDKNKFPVTSYKQKKKNLRKRVSKITKLKVRNFLSGVKEQLRGTVHLMISRTLILLIVLKKRLKIIFKISLVMKSRTNVVHK